MSPLQTQYPLSPRKFWKKIFSILVFWGILIVTIVGAAIFLKISLGSSPDSNVAQEILGIILSITLTLAVVIIVPYAIYVRAYIKRYYYNADEHFITIKKGVFAPGEIHVQYPKIQDVYVDQDIVDRVMGLYDVHIASATVSSGIEAHIDGVEFAAAEGLKNMFLDKIKGGGSMPATTPTMPVNAAPATVVLTEDISSKTYPIGARWVWQSVVGWFFGSLAYTLFLTIWLFAKSTDSSDSSSADFATSFLGISFTGVWFWSFVIFFTGHIIYALLWRATYSFQFLPEYIQMKSGVISRSEVHVPYKAVQDVTVKQSIIERLFGLATVNIENAAQNQMQVSIFTRGASVRKSGVTVPGQALDKANHLAEVIRSTLLTKNSAGTGL